MGIDRGFGQGGSSTLVIRACPGDAEGAAVPGSTAMHVFKGELFQFFAVGFVLGVVGLVLAMGSSADEAGLAMVPHAVAAPVATN